MREYTTKTPTIQNDIYVPVTTHQILLLESSQPSAGPIPCQPLPSLGLLGVLLGGIGRYVGHGYRPAAGTR